MFLVAYILRGCGCFLSIVYLRLVRMSHRQFKKYPIKGLIIKSYMKFSWLRHFFHYFKAYAIFENVIRTYKKICLRALVIQSTSISNLCWKHLLMDLTEYIATCWILKNRKKLWKKSTEPIPSTRLPQSRQFWEIFVVFGKQKPAANSILRQLLIRQWFLSNY